MKKAIYIFAIILLVLMIGPPLVVKVVYDESMVFVPHLFMNTWFSFVLSTAGLMINFILLYVIWERRKNRELTIVDCKILIFHLDFCIRLVQKCIDLINEFPGKRQISEDVNKNIRGKIKGLDNLAVIIAILKSGSYKNYNPEFALTLEELERRGVELVEDIKNIVIFTSEDSKGLRLLSELHKLLQLHKEKLESQHV
jgi:hypothetical protein